MNNPAENKDPILQVAWTRYAEFGAASKKRIKAQTKVHRWVAIISVLAILFAILSETYPQNLLPSLIVAIKVTLIILPTLGAALAALGNLFYPGSDGLILRAGAEQIQREIYLYRTTMRGIPERRVWLENRLREIQRQIYNALNGEMVLEPYRGELPPPYSVGNQREDKGFADLNANAYFVLRTKDQLDWHQSRQNRLQSERLRMQVYIIGAGLAGTVFAGIGAANIIKGIGLWAGLATAIVTALTGWKELRNLDLTIRNYSKVILELGFIADHWINLSEDQRSETEFTNMVNRTEAILWNQNIEYIKSMQEALEQSKETQTELIQQAVKQSTETVGRLDSLVAEAQAEEAAAQLATTGEGTTTEATITSEAAAGAPDFNPMTGDLVPEGMYEDPLEHLMQAMSGLAPEGAFHEDESAQPTAEAAISPEGSFHEETPAASEAAMSPEGSFEPSDSQAPPLSSHSSGGVGD